jgi:hypothetical protein
MSTDVHQHLLSEPLIVELSRRRRPPMLVRRDGGWDFRVGTEPDTFLPRAATDVARREEQMRHENLDYALIALSSALGVESLPADESAPLLEAHHLGSASLPDRFGCWGAVALSSPDPAEVDAALDRGCVGISLPAASLATPGALERLGPLLARLEARDAALFVHPGPVTSEIGVDARLPVWWPALTDYVAQMQAAWFAFLPAGRAAHPGLRVLFAMHAGGAPLHLERLEARGGPAAREPDPLVFYDTSSYGPRMLRAMSAIVGDTQLVHGSDRPVVGSVPSLDPQLERLLRDVNPRRLLFPGQKEDSDDQPHR